MKKGLVRKQNKGLNTVLAESNKYTPSGFCGCGICYCGKGNTALSRSNGARDSLLMVSMIAPSYPN